MANVKVKTIGAVFNGQPIGSTMEISKAEAEHYAKLGYIKILDEKPVKKESAPKKPVTQSKESAKPKTKAETKTKDK